MLLSLNLGPAQTFFVMDVGDLARCVAGELVAEAIDATTAGLDEIDATAVRDYLFSVTTETVLGPFSVYPMGDGRAGAQQALKGVLVQWQDDGSGELVQKIVHPPTVADAEVCWGR